MFASTDPQKILATVRSRAIELRVRLVSAVETAARLRAICVAEKLEADDVALRLAATFAKGHMRDAIMTLEQLSQLGPVTEANARAFLRLDRRDEVYDLLLTAEADKALPKLEQLLCAYAFGELQELVAQVLMDAFKVGLGLGDFAQADLAYLKRIHTKYGRELVPLAESILLAPSDVGTIQYGCSVFINRFWSNKDPQVKSLGLPSGDTTLAQPGYGTQFRKQS